MNMCTHLRRRRAIKRRDYLALFTTQTARDPDTGKDKRVARYIGPWYTLPHPAEQKRRVCLQMLALWAVAAAAFVLCGFANTQGSRTVYVLPFFLLLPFALFYWGLGIFRFWRSGPRFTEVDKDEGYDRLGSSTTGAMVLSALHTVGEAALLIGGEIGEALSLEVLAALGIALTGLCAWMTRRLLRPWEPWVEETQSQEGNPLAPDAQLSEKPPR